MECRYFQFALARYLHPFSMSLFPWWVYSYLSWYFLVGTILFWKDICTLHPQCGSPISPAPEGIASWLLLKPLFLSRQWGCFLVKRAHTQIEIAKVRPASTGQVKATVCSNFIAPWVMANLHRLRWVRFYNFTSDIVSHPRSPKVLSAESWQKYWN